MHSLLRVRVIGMTYFYITYVFVWLLVYLLVKIYEDVLKFGIESALLTTDAPQFLQTAL